MKIRMSERAVKGLTNAPPNVQRAFERRIRSLAADLRHPSLRAKKFDESRGEMVEIEPGEAEWSRDVLEGLLDFYFVQPALLQKKRDELNAKLAGAGKPSMK